MIRILVVDDDSGHRLILKNRLSEKGFDVVGADSGAKGLVEARGGSFELFLVAADLGSGIDGLEVCRRLKSIPETNGLPVVLFHTQANTSDLVERGYDAGCDAFALGQELHGLDHILRLLVRQRRHLLELADQIRAHQDQARRLHGMTPAAAPMREGESAARDAAEHQNVLRELASGRPDGILLVDGEGTVVHADRGACELLGARLEGRHLGSLVPASGLEAFVRDARIETREGFRFDVNLRRGRVPRSLTASVVPFVVMPGEHDHGLRVVLLQDAAKRRLAADILRMPERGIPRVEHGPLVEAAREVYRVDRLVGDAPVMRALREAVAQACTTSSPVLIVGPKGSGKERVARTLHFASTATGAFLQLRCAAMNGTDGEAELFGYVKNAFPGAVADRPGLLHLAADGTVYVEEIGSLARETQDKLAAFLKDGTMQRAGSRKPERVDVRIVASSSVPLDELVASGRITQELHARLSETVVRTPALAEHPEDLLAIAMDAVRRYGNLRGVREIADEALGVLRQHDWSGNGGELEDAIEQACSRAEGGVIQPEDLPRSLRERYGELRERDIIPVRRPAGPQHLGTHSVTPSPALPSTSLGGARGNSREMRPWDITDEDPVSLDLYEKKALLRALDQVEGDKLAAARLLKVGKSTLYRKLKRFGIH